MPAPTIRPLVLDAEDPATVQQAAAALRAGRLVALPTETVYGLGANAGDADAVRRIFAAKERPADNPLIVHVAEIEGLAAVARTVPPLAARLARQFWPGPLTLVVDAAPGVPGVVTGGLTTVAVRMPDHPATRAVLTAAAVPVAAPSANRSGRPSPTTAAHVVADLAEAVDVVVDGGPTVLGIESTVVDARGAVAVVLREGAVTREQLGATAVEQHSEHSPGTRYRHYAPRCPVHVVAPGAAADHAGRLAADGARVGLVATGAGRAPVITLAVFADAVELGRQLYMALRAGEEAACDHIVVEAVEAVGVGRAVMDRVRRAAGELTEPAR